MGFLNKIFGGEKSVASILVNTQRNIFNLYSINQPTDAQKMKASVYICIAGIAILNDLGGEKFQHVINTLVEETRELTKPLSMRIGELANNKEDLGELLENFSDQLQLSESTTVNGLAAFEALYFAKVEKLTNDILSHSNGPTGTPGYATVIVSGGIFGEVKSENFIEVSTQLLTFAKKLSKVI